jgi:hypothetical protein
MIKRILVTLAVATATALPAFPASSHIEPVACQTRHDLFALLNAADRHDTIAKARLTASACKPIAGTHYEIVGAANGVSTIRLFPREGDWASSRLAYTLDEMLAGE